MSLFGSRENQELRAELDRMASRLEKAEAGLKAALKKVESVEAANAAASATAEDARRTVANLRRDNERLNESKANAEKAVAFFEQKCSSAAAEVESARRELESSRLLESSARTLEAHLKGENARLKSEVERLSARLEQARTTTVEPGAVAAAPAEAADDSRVLRAEVEDLRRRLAETDEMRRVAVRKAEHNRRAWLITQMQLDLAEDRLCLITTGKPRPVLEGADDETCPDGETIEAEDVEGGDEVGPAVAVSEPE